MLIVGSTLILLLSTIAVVIGYKFGLFGFNSFAGISRASAKEHELDTVKKLPDAKINRGSLMFFATGLLISLSFSYYLMNYTEITTYITFDEDEEILLAEEELVTITEQTPPPPPPPKPEVVIPEIVESPDPIVDTTTIELEMEEEQEIAEEIFNFKETDDIDLGIEDNSIYDLSQLQDLPKFPLGDFGEFIRKNFDYPQRLLEQDEEIHGLLFVQFVVEKDGRLSDIIVPRGLHKLIDAEAIRVIKNSPSWTPGKNAGMPVRVKYIQPIRF